MGRVTVAAKVENLADLFAVDQGRLAPEQVRSVEVEDALVDSGAAQLSMPKTMLRCWRRLA